MGRPPVLWVRRPVVGVIAPDSAPWEPVREGERRHPDRPQLGRVGERDRLPHEVVLATIRPDAQRGSGPS